MSYTVDRYQSNSFEPGWPVVIGDGTINATATSLKLPGRGVPNYGELIAEDFVHLLENFAGPNQPLNPITGQLWFDADPTNPGGGTLRIYNGLVFQRLEGVQTDTSAFFNNPATGVQGDLRYYVAPGANRLFAHDGVRWNPVGGLAITATAPANPNNGDFWYNSTNQSLSIRQGSNWLGLVTTKIPQNPDAGTIATSNFVAVVTGNQVIVVYSHAVVPVGSLSTSFTLLDGSTTVNLQTLFPSGLAVGANYSRIANNALRGDPGSGNNFDVRAITGNLRLGANVPNQIILQGASNTVTVPGKAEFTTTGAMKLPSGNLIERPILGVAVVGDFRHNSLNNQLEYYSPAHPAADGDGWVSIDPAGGVGDGFAAGTRMVFYMSTAPSGWSTDNTLNEHALRVVPDSSGGGVADSSGQDFTTAFTDYTATEITGSVDGHALTISEMPRHGHPWRGNTRTETTGRINVDGGFSTRNAGQVNNPPNFGPAANPQNRTIGGEGGVYNGGPVNLQSSYDTEPHTHGVSGVTLGINLQVKYANVIIAQKS